VPGRRRGVLLLPWDAKLAGLGRAAARRCRTAALAAIWRGRSGVGSGRVRLRKPETSGAAGRSDDNT